MFLSLVSVWRLAAPSLAYPQVVGTFIPIYRTKLRTHAFGSWIGNMGNFSAGRFPAFKIDACLRCERLFAWIRTEGMFSMHKTTHFLNLPLRQGQSGMHSSLLCCFVLALVFEVKADLSHRIVGRIYVIHKKKSDCCGCSLQTHCPHGSWGRSSILVIIETVLVIGFGREPLVKEKFLIIPFGKFLYFWFFDKKLGKPIGNGQRSLPPIVFCFMF